MENRDTAQENKNRGHARKAVAGAIAAVTIAYLSLVVSGAIKPSNRLNAAEFGAVIVAAIIVFALLRPDVVNRLEKIDVAGIKLDLGEVKERQIEVQKIQQEQKRSLDDLRFTMRMLIKPAERQHLLNLHMGRTNYMVKGALREELRHLRAMGLIRMRGDKTVGGMPEKVQFDLASYVMLTPDGEEYVTRFGDQLDGQAKEASTGA